MSLAELDQLLMIEFHIDYWSDNVVLHATQLTKNLNTEEWERLRTIWHDRPVNWQISLADALLGSPEPHGSELLATMLSSPYVEVALAAAESLEAQSDMWTPDPSLVDVLRQLSTKVKVEDRPVIDRLLSRVSPA
jgi:hypothetical protein